MPKFITFFSYTREAARAMIASPSDRPAAARALVESLGGKMEAFYWMQGDHDGFVIADYPDGITAAALSVAAGSTPALCGMLTQEIFDGEAQVSMLQAAKRAVESYKPPTA